MIVDTVRITESEMKAFGLGVTCLSLVAFAQFSKAETDAEIERGLQQAEARHSWPEKIDEATTWIGMSHVGKYVTFTYQIDTKRYEVYPDPFAGFCCFASDL